MQLSDFKTNNDPKVVPTDWYWERIRIWRDKELRDTDFTQLPDCKMDKEIWATYRQELRDLPNTTLDIKTIKFPVKP
jgi:hypothetical protein